MEISIIKIRQSPKINQKENTMIMSLDGINDVLCITYYFEYIFISRI